MTVLLRIRQLASELSLAAVILISAGTVSGTNEAPTAALSSKAPDASLVIVARMLPSTTSGVADRRTLNVAVPASTSTMAANVGMRFGGRDAADYGGGRFRARRAAGGGGADTGEQAYAG